MSTKIETDFTELANQINAKIKEAAEAMKQANALAKAAGLSSLTYDEYDDDSADTEEEQDKIDEFRGKVNIYPLFGELDKAGWHTSSIGC